MKFIYTIIVVLIMLFVITFSLQNTFPVHVAYINWVDVTMPAYMLIFTAFLAGVVFTGFMEIIERFRLNRTIKRLNRTIRELKREIQAHENPPMIEQEFPPNRQP